MIQWQLLSHIRCPTLPRWVSVLRHGSRPGGHTRGGHVGCRMFVLFRAYVLQLLLLLGKIFAKLVQAIVGGQGECPVQMAKELLHI